MRHMLFLIQQKQRKEVKQNEKNKQKMGTEQKAILAKFQ